MSSDPKRDGAGIYTIGSGSKSARQFFELLKRYGIRRLIDVRLHNTSQLAGFAKKDDLEYFLREICGIQYAHEPRLAPLEELMTDYKQKRTMWAEFEVLFGSLLDGRSPLGFLEKQAFLEPTVLLCSEPSAEKCHRRLVAEYLAANWGLEVIHL